MSRETKLAELRSKTDVDLVRYVTSELDLGVRFALESDYRSHIRAQEAYLEIARLLPVIHHLGEPQRRRLEAKLRRLRQMLNRLPALTLTA